MRSIRIKVPATSANLGPGFDSLGLALQLYNRFEVFESEGIQIEGCPPEHAKADNLFVRAFRHGLEAAGLSFQGIGLRIDAEIPIARGLGSSSACIVGGLLAAAAVAEESGRQLDTQALLDLAAEVEGHPDNTTPALLGGFAVAVPEGKRVVSIRTEVDESLVFNAFVPPFQLETVKARAVLPKQISFSDAAFNAGHAALTASAFLSRDYARLGEGCRDRLHEPYRAPLIAGFEEIVAAAREAGALATFLSGAGPTIMAICRAGNEGFAAAMAGLLGRRREGAWRLLPLRPDNVGAHRQRLED